jgi:hypothetical protein
MGVRVVVVSVRRQHRTAGTGACLTPGRTGADRGRGDETRENPPISCRNRHPRYLHLTRRPVSRAALKRKPDDINHRKSLRAEISKQKRSLIARPVHDRDSALGRAGLWRSARIAWLDRTSERNEHMHPSAVGIAWNGLPGSSTRATGLAAGWVQTVVLCCGDPAHARPVQPSDTDAVAVVNHLILPQPA